MGALDGRVAIITGAGRGIGREHALLFASEGAKVVVNDLGGGADGTGADRRPAARGRRRDQRRWVGRRSPVTTTWPMPSRPRRWSSRRSTRSATCTSLVNNAGILRDRMVFSMSDEEWDDVVRVHLRGHFMPTKFAASHWRQQAKAGKPVKAAIVNTTSTSGLMSNPGQTNYGAAKSGIATFTEICQKELGRYGVRSNAIAPAARTRLTMTVPGAEERYAEREAKPEAAGSGFDKSDPANISPFVAYLATEDCPIAGKVVLRVGQRGPAVPAVDDRRHAATDGRWTVEGLETAAKKWGDVEFDQTIRLD